MSSTVVPVDPVDLNWRIFQTREKKLTSRGRSRLSGHRYTRDHEVLEKHDGSPKHSGRRFVALARATVCDLADGAAELFESDEDVRPARPVIGYSRCAKKEFRRRRQADLRELDEHERATMQRIESELADMARQHHCSQSWCNTLMKHVAQLEAQLKQASPALQKELVTRILRAELELFEVETLMPYAA